MTYNLFMDKVLYIPLKHTRINSKSISEDSSSIDILRHQGN